MICIKICINARVANARVLGYYIIIGHSRAVEGSLAVNHKDYLYSSARNNTGLEAVIDPSRRIERLTMVWKTVK